MTNKEKRDHALATATALIFIALTTVGAVTVIKFIWKLL